MQNTVATRLTELRRNAGNPTQKTVAKGVGCAYRSYQNWEGNKVVPSYRNAQGLARYFNTTPEYILYGIDGTTPAPAAMDQVNERLSRIERLLLRMAGEPDSLTRARRSREIRALSNGVDHRQSLAPVVDADHPLPAQEGLL